MSLSGATWAFATFALAAQLEPRPAQGDAPAGAVDAVRYGDWLLVRGDLYRAIGEYQRALYLDPTGPLGERLELRVARAYALGGKPDASAAVLARLESSARDPATRDEALFERGRVRYAAHQAGAAVEPLASYVGRDAPAGGPGPSRARLLLGLARLRAGDPAGAVETLACVAPGDPLAADADRLRAALGEVASAPYRSPVVAGLLSAAIPGLGHAYAGDAWAGAGAFALNGLFIWAAVESFRDHRPAFGTLLLVGESIWYGGAVFGAVAEAMRFNRDGRERVLDAVDARFAWTFAIAPLPDGVVVGVGGTLGR